MWTGASHIPVRHHHHSGRFFPTPSHSISESQREECGGKREPSPSRTSYQVLDQDEEFNNTISTFIDTLIILSPLILSPPLPVRLLGVRPGLGRLICGDHAGLS